jgi:hypothetical protein
MAIKAPKIRLIIQSAVVIIAAIVAVYGVAWLIRETFNNKFIGKQTQLLYRCKENHRVHRDCIPMLRERGLYTGPEDEEQFKVGHDPIEVVKPM